jgi:glutamyl-tRNA synthetase
MSVAPTTPPSNLPSLPALTPTTRLAPSPTGALHLGNARTFLLTWVIARQRGWRIVLRVEDLDTPRVKPGTIDAAIDTLRWLGVDWDEGPIIQSTDLVHHRRAMQTLASRGLVYPSNASRGAVEEAAASLALSAPQEGAHDVVYPASLRPAMRPVVFADDGSNWRFVVEPGSTSVNDEVAGSRVFDVSTIVGDFVVWTKRGTPSYQLAVVVDDHRQRVTHVVRGDDLLDSAARQTLLYRALGLGPSPAYLHLPLVVGSDGRRLAKRHGDTRVDMYRSRGVTSERMIGLIAFWSGVSARRTSMSAQELRHGFRLDTLPRGPVSFTPEDDAWLLE